MKKKAFVTIYVLLLLLVLSISLSFIFDQNKNNADFNKDLYDKKQALYTSESISNLASKNPDFEDYKTYVYKEIKDHYYGVIISEKLDEKIQADTKYTKLSYDNKTYKPKFIYYDDSKRIRLLTKATVGDTIGQTAIDYEVVPKFDFTSKDPIVYKFDKDLIFENIKFEENPELIDLEENLKEDKFYKINGNLYIEDMSSENDEDKDNDEEKNEGKTDSNKEKLDKNEAKKESNNLLKDENKKYHRLIYIDGDLILKTDLELDGLLILNGKLKVEDSGKKKPKLKLKGQIISRDKIDKDVLDFTYDKKSYKFIVDIKNLFDTNFLSKRVY